MFRSWNDLMICSLSTVPKELLSAALKHLPNIRINMSCSLDGHSMAMTLQLE
jgi:hypothetical protein